MREPGRESEPTWPSVLGTLSAGRDLDPAAASWAMARVMEGGASDAQIAAFGVALQMKGVSGPELDAIAATMLDFAVPLSVPTPCVDIVGTGGDRHGTVNISTMASLVVAAAGVPVVKHGNRASSSKSGGADVLEALGVRITLGPDAVARCVEELGIAFCFAPVFHPALRHAAGPRREIGIPTVFNVLGPLANPAQPASSLIGCAFAPLMRVMAEVFAMRGHSALVVRGSDGLDEITTTGETSVLVVRDGRISEATIRPGDLGLDTAELDDLRGGDAVVNAGVAREVLAGAPGPVRDAVLANAAGALVAFDGGSEPAGLVPALRAALGRAADAVDSGAAGALLDRWVEVSNSLG